jgi:hypothetical protein
MIVTGCSRQEAGEAADLLEAIRSRTDFDPLTHREEAMFEQLYQALRTTEWCPSENNRTTGRTPHHLSASR